MLVPAPLVRIARGHRSPAIALLLAGAIASLALGPDDAHASHAPSQGFGADTPGGAGRPIVRVTNLDDSGPGSLRAAVSGGARTVVFDVAGDIVLTSLVRVRGAFITIDGASAPPPGITLRGHGLGFVGTDGTHDVIVRSLRIRAAVEDGIGIAYGAHNILLEHLSIQGSSDGNIDITTGAHDITVAWCILGTPAGDSKNMLVKYEAVPHHAAPQPVRRRGGAQPAGPDGRPPAPRARHDRRRPAQPRVELGQRVRDVDRGRRARQRRPQLLLVAVLHRPSPGRGLDGRPRARVPGRQRGPGRRGRRRRRRFHRVERVPGAGRGR